MGQQIGLVCVAIDPDLDPPQPLVLNGQTAPGGRTLRVRDRLGDEVDLHTGIGDLRRPAGRQNPAAIAVGHRVAVGVHHLRQKPAILVAQLVGIGVAARHRAAPGRDRPVDRAGAVLAGHRPAIVARGEDDAPIALHTRGMGAAGFAAGIGRRCATGHKRRAIERKGVVGVEGWRPLPHRDADDVAEPRDLPADPDITGEEAAGPQAEAGIIDEVDIRLDPAEGRHLQVDDLREAAIIGRLVGLGLSRLRRDVAERAEAARLRGCRESGLSLRLRLTGRPGLARFRRTCLRLLRRGDRQHAAGPVDHRLVGRGKGLRRR